MIILLTLTSLFALNRDFHCRDEMRLDEGSAKPTETRSYYFLFMKKNKSLPSLPLSNCNTGVPVGNKTA